MEQLQQIGQMKAAALAVTDDEDEDEYSEGNSLEEEFQQKKQSQVLKVKILKRKKKPSQVRLKKHSDCISLAVHKYPRSFCRKFLRS